MGVPSSLECPVSDDRIFPVDLSSLWIPAYSSVVLPAREKQIIVLSTP